MWTLQNDCTKTWSYEQRNGRKSHFLEGKMHFMCDKLSPLRPVFFGNQKSKNILSESSSVFVMRVLSSFFDFSNLIAAGIIFHREQKFSKASGAFPAQTIEKLEWVLHYRIVFSFQLIYQNWSTGLGAISLVVTILKDDYRSHEKQKSPDSELNQRLIATSFIFYSLGWCWWTWRFGCFSRGQGDADVCIFQRWKETRIFRWSQWS